MPGGSVNGPVVSDGPPGGCVEACASAWIGRPANHATGAESTARSTVPLILRRVRDTIRACSNMLATPLLLDLLI